MTTPALPDTERLTEYTVAVASVGPYSVGFHIYCDDDDLSDAALEVWDDGVQLTAETDYTVSSVAGGADLSIIARPITDAQITFTVARSGEIKIVGARRPRQASQFTNGQSTTADQHNRRYTDLMATARELWDLKSRMFLALPGALGGIITGALNGVLSGPASSTDNAVPRWNGTSGAAIQDSGVIVDDDNNVSGIANLSVGGVLLLTGDLTPSQITSNQDNYNPTGLSTASTLRLSTDASRNITGLAGGADGRIIQIENVGAQNIVLNDESGSSTAANRFALAANVTLAPDQLVNLKYDATSQRWRLFGIPGSQSIVSTDNAIPRFDGTGGNLQNSGITIDDSNNVTMPNTSYFIGTSTNGTKFDTTNGMAIVSTANVCVQLDTDNDDAVRTFQVRKDSPTPGGGTLLFEVHENGQVAIGQSTVAAERQLYVELPAVDPTNTNAHWAIEGATDYTATADTDAVMRGVYGLARARASTTRTYSGLHSGVGGNWYSLGAGTVNHTQFACGVYGRCRAEAPGTISNAIAIFADGAQTTGATITNAMALYVAAQTAATNDYGIYFENNPGAGSIAAAANVTISTKVTGTGTITLGTAGGAATLDASGHFTGSGNVVSGPASGTAALLHANATGAATASLRATAVTANNAFIRLVSGSTTWDFVMNDGSYSGAFRFGYNNGNPNFILDGFNPSSNVKPALWVTSAAIKTLMDVAIPAAGTTGTGIQISSTANFGIFFGSGAPTLSAAQGSIYLRSDGSTTATRMYVNTNGTTGWTNFTTAT